MPSWRCRAKSKKPKPCWQIHRLNHELPAQLEPVKTQLLAGVPEPGRAAAEAGFQQLAGGNINLNDLTGVGQSFGTVVLNQAPAQFQAFIQPFVPQFDQAFNNAMSLAIAQTFWIGVATGVGAVVAAFFMRELPLRSTNASPATVANTPTEGGRTLKPTGTPAD